MSAMTGPAFEDVGVLAFVPDRWSQAWTTRHHVLTRLGKYYRTVWVEQPRYWRNAWSESAGSRSGCAEKTYPGFSVSPSRRWLPRVFQPRSLGKLLYRVHVQMALQQLQDFKVKKLVIYLWRPTFAPVRALLQADLCVYHVDDEYSFSDEDRPTPAHEEDLLRSADRVIIHSRELLKKKGHYNPATAYIPNGVDYLQFAEPRPEPDDLLSVPSPRVGYVGVLKRQLNLRILNAIARKRPGVALVLVGPIGNMAEKRQDLQTLLQLPNVHYLGEKRAEELPGYIQHLDICLMCYEVNGYTKYINPLKLNEYLSAGKPVISSPLASLQEVRDVMKLAHDEEEWLSSIDAQLNEEESIQAKQRRQEVARSRDWSYLIRRIALEIATGLGPDFERRLPEDGLREAFPLLKGKSQHAT